MYYLPQNKKFTLTDNQRRISLSSDFQNFFSILNLEEKVVFIKNKTYFQYAYHFRRGIDHAPLMSITTDFDGKIIEARCHICQSNGDCHHLEHMVNDIIQKYQKLSLDEIWIENRKQYIRNKEEEEKTRLAEEKKSIIRKESLAKVTSLLEEMNQQDVQPLLKLVSLVPVITVFQGYKEKIYDISLKVGIDKMYSITSIANFLDNVALGREYSYGKQLAFKHTIASFDAPSQGLIELLRDMRKRLDSSTSRSLDGNSTLFEKVLMLYQGHTLEINNLLPNQTSNLYVIALNPHPINIRLNSNYVFEIINDEGVLLDGVNHSFYIKNNIIDLVTLADKKLLPLYKFIKSNPFFSYEHIKDVLIKEILARFYQYIVIDDAIKEEVSIKDFTIEAYIDYREDKITLESKYQYNGEAVSEEEIRSYKGNDLKLGKYQLLIHLLGFENDVISDPGKIFQFLATDLTNLKAVATVYLSEKLLRLQTKKYQPVKMNLSYNTNMLSICFTDSQYSDEELAKIIKGLHRKTKYIKLKNNVILEVDDESAKKLLNTIEEFNLNIDKLTSPQNLPLYQALKLSDHNLEIVETVATEQIKALIADIAKYKEANYPIPRKLSKQMRSYQKEAFLWMKTLIKHGLSGILADDMGLGKTLEMISVISSVDEAMPSLIVCPKSLCYNWKNEFDLWAPDLKVVNIIGNAHERQELISGIKNEKSIYITSYDSLRIDLEFYDNKLFQFLILDEGQYIKNHDTLKAQSVKCIQAQYRFVLTGTPIENTVMDLWSIFDFLMPGYLGSITSFRAKYERAIIEHKDQATINNLVLKISPFILRRTKQDVIKDLPDKIEIIQASRMTEEQNKLYQAELKKTRDIIKHSDNKIEILACITRLRQVCVDPGMYLDNYQGGSGKVDLAMDLIDQYIANEHRVILFSQFTTIFEKLASELKKRKIKYYLLTGKTAAEERVLMASDFNANDEYKVFLVSLKAGGTGLNLIGADVVIHLDPWWNVAAENQATDRAHRIGQTRVVQVIKLVCEDSIEQKVIELQERKKEIVKMIVADDDSNIQKLSKEDLAFLVSE